MIKGSVPLEHLNDADVILFDKTGTLTQGKPTIQTFEVHPKADKQEVIDVVVALEIWSTHPLAKVVVEYLYDEHHHKYEVEIKEIAGQGVSSTIEGSEWSVGKFETIESDFADEFEQNKKGHTIIKVVKDRDLVAYFLLQDSIRENAEYTIDALKDLGLKTYLLTGDYKESVQSLLEHLHVDGYYAELLPKDKSKIVEGFKAEDLVVAMVGDGINDAPALALADVGIAMGQGTDVALETAEIVFLNNKLESSVSLVKLARKARQIVNQNVVFSMSVLSILVLLNVFELLTLPVGVLFHEGSTILVILNGLRLLWFKP